MLKEILEFIVKSNIGEVTKGTKELTNEASNAVGEFKFMGVSLNGVKKAFASAAVTAKGMFGAIKTGIISTGIGAFVVLISSLVTYFTSTKRGADQLAQAFTAVGAVVDVLTDRFSRMGEVLTLVFSGDFKKAAEMAKGMFSGITAEIKGEVNAMVALKKRTQELRDADNEFMTQKAKTRQEIEKARLNAEDETKSAKERLDALKTALTLEEKTTKRELELARERLAIKQEEMNLSENSAEDEEKLAQLKTELIEVETASVKMRRRVITEVNAFEKEINAEAIQRAKDAKDAQDIIDAAKIQAAKDLEAELKDIRDEAANQLILDEAALLDSFAESQLTEQQREQNAIYEKYNAIITAKKQNGEDILELETNLASEIAAVQEKYGKEEIENEKAVLEAKKAIRDANVSNIEAGIGLVKDLAGENKSILAAAVVAENAVGIAKMIMANNTANVAALATPQAILTSGVSAIPVIAANNISTAIGVASSIAATAKALSQLGGGGSAGSAPSLSGGSPAPTSTTPAPQMMSGAFELGGGVKPEPLEAYVITDKMTSSQNQLANIRRRATI
jgi:hypothetical protein